MVVPSWKSAISFTSFRCFFSFFVSEAPLTHTCGPVGIIGVRGWFESGLELWPVSGSGAIGVQKEEMGEYLVSNTVIIEIELPNSLILLN